MANKVIALFVEGPTEIEFYKAVIREIHNLQGSPFSCEIVYHDMKGIGNYKKDALRRFKTLQKTHIGKEIDVFFCIDHDAFIFSKKPPFNQTELKKLLLKEGAKKVSYIVANQSIEDWFLCDLEGILGYLRLPKTTKRPKGNGQDALKRLFKSANRLYVKGGKAEGFIEKIDVIKIMKTHCKSFNPLCKSLKLSCKVICDKK